jgi:putative SOS response-associated peptidase YedK
VCGRFTLAPAAGRLFGPRFGLAEDVSVEPRWNIAPSTSIPVITRREGANRADWMHWGLVPVWADSPEVGSKMINARAETLTEKRSFSPLLEQNRCLVPADGFYEWQARAGAAKQPWYFHEPSGDVFSFAGLWTSWRPGDGVEPLESVTIVTTEPNALVRPVHKRMPAILAAGAEESWLDHSIAVEEALGLLGPAPDGMLVAEPVSTRVNRVANDDRECVQPVAEDQGTGAESLF